MYLPGEIDWRVMSLSAGICLVTTLIVGLIPAFQTRNVDIGGALKAESQGVVWRAEASVGAIRPGRPAGLLKLYSAGWSGTLAAKPAQDSNRQPGLSPRREWSRPACLWSRLDTTCRRPRRFSRSLLIALRQYQASSPPHSPA